MPDLACPLRPVGAPRANRPLSGGTDADAFTPSPILATADILSIRSFEPARYSDRDLRGERAKGMAFTALLYGSILAFLFVEFLQPAALPVPPLAPATFQLSPPAAPAEPVRDVKEGPEQIEQPKVEAVTQSAVTPPEVLPPAINPDRPAEQREAPSRPPVAETTAPKSVPAPPAEVLSSDTPDSWQSRLLVHLERYRRFPSDARARREEGTVYVSFRMNRAGKLLAARVIRSSGSAALDKAALETLRRAQPLPAIPKDLPEEVALDVPVEFFLR